VTVAASAALRGERVATLAASALAATSIGALLADLYGLAEMSLFAWVVTLPSLAALAALGSWPSPRLGELRRRIRVGAVAGVVGTIGYDVVRIPFAVAGFRLFAPIDSYGLLIADASMGSPWTGTLGWLFHLSNGVTFGVMYALVAARRHWGWGVLWGLVLETAVVATPFRERYGLGGEWVAIGIAYAAHVGFGYPVGRLVQRLDRTDEELRAVTRRPATAVIVAAVVAIVVWQHPWEQSGLRRDAGALAAGAPGPVALVTSDRFVPEWLRVAEGECATVVNRSRRSYRTAFGTVPAGGEGRLCFPDAGVHRVKLGGRPYSGGFVYVDPR
jgi:hypothetical protein